MLRVTIFGGDECLVAGGNSGKPILSGGTTLSALATHCDRHPAQRGTGRSVNHRSCNISRLPGSDRLPIGASGEQDAGQQSYPPGMGDQDTTVVGRSEGSNQLNPMELKDFVRQKPQVCFRL